MSRAKSGITRLARQAEVDRAGIYGVLTTMLGLASGPVTILLIALYFSPEVQGYYYTFASLLALQVFVELGLGTVIIQFASHEWSRLELNVEGRIVGSAESLSRLISLGRLALGWYAVAGAIMVVGVGLAGYVFFSQSPSSKVHWVSPWFVLCLLSGLNLASVPIWSVLEGCNQVPQVYGYRLMQAALRTVTICLAIALGAELWTAAVVSAVSLVLTVAFLRVRYRFFFHAFLSPPTGAVIGWRSEIWPMQWRIALSWLSGYFVFSLFTPVLFHYHGAVAAGQMGMTWSALNAFSGFCSVWVQTKAPRFGVLIAKKEYTTLDRLLFRSAALSLVLACFGATVIWLITYFLYLLKHPLATRILPPLPMALFLVATVLLQISYPQSIYLRAHKKEPFLGLSVVGGFLIGLSTWILGRWFAATGMAAGYLAVIALFSIPVGTLIWYRCRAEWHRDVEVGSGNLVGV